MLQNNAVIRTHASMLAKFIRLDSPLPPIPAGKIIERKQLSLAKKFKQTSKVRIMETVFAQTHRGTRLGFCQEPGRPDLPPAGECPEIHTGLHVP